MTDRIFCNMSHVFTIVLDVSNVLQLCRAKNLNGNKIKKILRPP